MVAGARVAFASFPTPAATDFELAAAFFGVGAAANCGLNLLAGSLTGEVGQRTAARMQLRTERKKAQLNPSPGA